MSQWMCLAPLLLFGAISGQQLWSGLTLDSSTSAQVIDYVHFNHFRTVSAEFEISWPLVVHTMEAITKFVIHIPAHVTVHLRDRNPPKWFPHIHSQCIMHLQLFFCLFVRLFVFWTRLLYHWMWMFGFMRLVFISLADVDHLFVLYPTC